MARRGQPVLYELLGSGAASSAQASSAPGSDPHHAHSAHHVHGAPRQSIRVPVGWFWLSAVLALALVAIAYQFGRAAGDRAGLARGQEWRSDGDLQSRIAGETPDPARAGTGGAALSGGTAPVRRAGDSAAATAKDRGSNSGASSSTTTPVSTADPRVKGFNYWIVARTSAEESQAMADFVRGNGLEVAVVSDNNPRFVRVVALPGVSEGRSSEVARRQEAKIKSIGKLWKNAARGHRDFDDTYLELYR